MTIFLPLEASSPFPSFPSFLVPPSDPKSQVDNVIKAVMKAKRIVVVCGAGVSVRAGIPDFRSSDGLFHTLKRDNPRETLSSGRDLFDASVFNSEHMTSLFCQMIAQLFELSQAATPTPFHHVLRALDDRGKLLRVYTQNIDAIEAKSGLSFGIPEFDGRRSKSKAKGKEPLRQLDSDVPMIPVLGTSSRLPSPPAETPRCVPLHGTVETVHCQTCTFSYPLVDYLPSLSSGIPPECPECAAMEATRQLVGKRARGVGRLRPSVVLYNETHQNGEGVGEVVRKDLVGGGSKGKGGSRSGADLLLVVGTSLRVPGTKRIVREFAKAVHSRFAARETSKDGSQASTFGLQSPSPSPRRTPASEEEPPIKTVYLNLDFPVPTREWEGVFDVWLQGDAQKFAVALAKEIERDNRAKEAAQERRLKREEEAVRLREMEENGIQLSTPSKKKRKRTGDVADNPSQARLSPPQTPSLSEKIVIRIPPRPRHVPEVYIPNPTTPRKVTNAKKMLPSPPLTTHVSTAKRRPISSSSSMSEDSLSEMEADETNILPCFRNADHSLLHGR